MTGSACEPDSGVHNEAFLRKLMRVCNPPILTWQCVRQGGPAAGWCPPLPLMPKSRGACLPRLQLRFAQATGFRMLLHALECAVRPRLRKVDSAGVWSTLSVQTSREQTATMSCDMRTRCAAPGKKGRSKSSFGCQNSSGRR